MITLACGECKQQTEMDSFEHHDLSPTIMIPHPFRMGEYWGVKYFYYVITWLSDSTYLLTVILTKYLLRRDRVIRGR